MQSRVDTIEIGFDVIFTTEEIAALNISKELAGRPGAGGSTVFTIGDEAFELRAKGKRGHPFVLCHGPTEILVSETDVEVRLRPAMLRTQSVEASLDYARSLAANLARVVNAERIRRIDACADVTFAIRDVDSSAFVGRVRESIAYERAAVGGNTTSITFGRGGPLSVRIYDKVEQLRQKGVPAASASERMEWARHGWRDGAPITRVEMQLRGPTLRRLDMRDPARVMVNLDAAWQYVFSKWVRLVEPLTSTRRERAKLDQRWLAVLGARFVRAADAARPLIIDRVGSTVESAMGTVVSALAATGLLRRSAADVSAEEHIARLFVAAVRARPLLCSTLPWRIEVALARAGLSPAFEARGTSRPGAVRTKTASVSSRIEKARQAFRDRYAIAIDRGASERVARRLALAAVPGFGLLAWAGCFDLERRSTREQAAR